MALDDLADNAKEHADKKKAKELASKLGVGNREELEELDDRIGTISQMLVSQDKRIEELEEEVETLRTLVRNLTKEVVSDDGN